MIVILQLQAFPRYLFFPSKFLTEQDAGRREHRRRSSRELKALTFLQFLDGDMSLEMREQGDLMGRLGQVGQLPDDVKPENKLHDSPPCRHKGTREPMQQ